MNLETGKIRRESSLDERLEIFKDKSGDVRLTPGQAKEVLLMTLIEDYRDNVNEISPKVEALIEIMTTQERNGKNNYTELLARITSKREGNIRRISRIRKSLRRSRIKR